MKSQEDEVLASDYTRRADHYLGVNSANGFITIINLGAQAVESSNSSLSLRIIVNGLVSEPGTFRITRAEISANSEAFVSGLYIGPRNAPIGQPPNLRLSITALDNPINQSYVTITSVDDDQLIGTFRFVGNRTLVTTTGTTVLDTNIFEGSFTCPRSSAVF